MEHIAKLQPCWVARLHSRASIHSDLPELGTPVTMDSSPGTTCAHACRSSTHYMMICHLQLQCYFFIVNDCNSSHHMIDSSHSSWDTPCSSYRVLTSPSRHPDPWHPAHRTCSRSHPGTRRTCNSKTQNNPCSAPQEKYLATPCTARDSEGRVRGAAHLKRPLIG